jgi:Tfp pilus assembly protein PilF
MDSEDVESFFRRVLSISARIRKHCSCMKDSKLRPLSESEALQAAGIFLTQRNVEQAEAYFHAALKQNDSSTPAWKGLALIYASKAQWKEATGAFLQAGDCDGARKAAAQMESIPPDVAGQIEERCN